MKWLLLIFQFLVLAPLFTKAQIKRFSNSTHKQAIHREKKSFKPIAYTSIGFGLSALNYYGDLSPRPSRISTDFKMTKPGLSIFFARRYGPFSKFQIDYLHGTITGDDSESASPTSNNGKYRFQRNTSFRNRVNEISFTNFFEFPRHDGIYYRRPILSYHAYAGVAIVFHNPQAKAPATDLNGNPLQEAGHWVDLKPLGTEGQYSNLLPTDANYGIKPYSKIIPAILTGLGVTYRINESIDISLDFTLRYFFTDYLDDVSRNYVDLGALNSPLAKAMSYRSNTLILKGEPLQNYSYQGRDGNAYNVIPGYGSEFRDNMRGSRKDTDTYTSTTIKISKIITPSIHKAKGR